MLYRRRMDQKLDQSTGQYKQDQALVYLGLRPVNGNTSSIQRIDIRHYTSLTIIATNIYLAIGILVAQK